MHVVIAGAGLLGLTTAWYLRRAGADVSVVDRQPGPGLETSFANGGMLHASQANPWNEPGVLGTALRMMGREDAALLVRPRALPGMWRWGWSFVRHSNPVRYLRNFEKNAHLARCSLAEMEVLRAALGAQYAASRRGTLKLFRTPREVAGAARLCSQLDQWGIRHEVVDARGAAHLEPALAPIEAQLAGGVFSGRRKWGCPSVLWLACPRACRGGGQLSVRHHPHGSRTAPGWRDVAHDAR